MFKICSKCKIEKDMESNFYRDKAEKDGYRYQCKDCIRQYKEIIKDKTKTYKRNYDVANEAKRQEYQKGRRPFLRKYLREYNKKRRETDLNFKLSCNIRGRLSSIIKNNKKSGSSIKDLGCTLEQLRLHLETQFQPGMSWNNYGSGTGMWSIDHIIPLSLFNLEDRNQFIKACNFNNLQPMWSNENSRKYNDINLIAINLEENQIEVFTSLEKINKNGFLAKVITYINSDIKYNNYYWYTCDKNLINKISLG